MSAGISSRLERIWGNIREGAQSICDGSIATKYNALSSDQKDEVILKALLVAGVAFLVFSALTGGVGLLALGLGITAGALTAAYVILHINEEGILSKISDFFQNLFRA